MANYIKTCVSKKHSIICFRLHLFLPLIPLAGFASARVAATTWAEHKLVILEAQAAGHAGTGIGPPVGGTHGDEAVRTVAGEALRWTQES